MEKWPAPCSTLSEIFFWPRISLWGESVRGVIYILFLLSQWKLFLSLTTPQEFLFYFSSVFFSFTTTASYPHIWAYFHDPYITLPLVFIPKLGPEKHYNHCLLLGFMIANNTTFNAIFKCDFSFSHQSVPFSIEKWILLVLLGIYSQASSFCFLLNVSPSLLQ